jgi:hypothetical protein
MTNKIGEIIKVIGLIKKNKLKSNQLKITSV